VGWVICRKQSVEETKKSAEAHKTNVADFHGAILSLRSWVPQSMSERGVCNGKLITVDIIMSHWEGAGGGVLGARGKGREPFSAGEKPHNIKLTTQPPRYREQQ